MVLVHFLRWRDVITGVKCEAIEPNGASMRLPPLSFPPLRRTDDWISSPPLPQLPFFFMGVMHLATIRLKVGCASPAGLPSAQHTLNLSSVAHTTALVRA